MRGENHDDRRLAGETVRPLQDVKPTGETQKAREDLEDPIGRGANPHLNPALTGPTADPTFTSARLQTGSAGMPDTQVDAASFWSRAGLMPKGADGQALPAPSLGYALPNAKSSSLPSSNDILENLRVRKMDGCRAAKALAAAALARLLANGPRPRPNGGDQPPATDHHE
jgi:hypothetical protein